MRVTRELIHLAGRFLRIAQPTGTQRSARRFMEATLTRLPPGQVVVHAPVSSHAELAASGLAVTNLPGSTGRYDHLWEQLVLPAQASGGVIWTLMGTGPVFHPGSRHVMVVHDLNFMLLPGAYGRAFRSWYRLACAAAAQRADAIVCFSDYVRQSIHALLGIPLLRISVIPQGPGLAGISLSPNGRENPDGRYFLCVGSLQPHKNLQNVLKAWQKYSQRNPGYKLKVVGRKQANFSQLSFEGSLLQQPGVEFTGYISDADLIALYQGATGFLFPSYEEGFGLPVVEAFYCGCPVITANRSCLPEVAGNAALLVDPAEPKQLETAMEQLAMQPDLRRRLRKAGLTRATNFTWTNAGKKMAEVLMNPAVFSGSA